MQLGSIEFDQILVLNALNVVYFIGHRLYLLNVICSELNFLQRHWLTRVQVDTRIDFAKLTLAY
jgi:hypothetical protein